MKFWLGGALAWARHAAPVGVLLGLVLAGCSPKAVLDAAASPQDRALCTQVIADLQGGPEGEADILAKLTPELRPKFAPILPRMRALTPHGSRAASRLVDARFNVVQSTNGSSWRDSYLAYEVDAGAQRVLVRFEILRQNGSAQINSLYINSLNAPVEATNSFSLAGKSAVQYAVLALAVLAFATTIASETVLIMTRGIRRKWLWGIGCLFGYGQVWVDWTSGAIGFQPVNIQLLAAFFLKAGLLEPWRIGFGLPIVSIIFLVRRRSLIKAAKAAVDKTAVAAF